MTSQHITLDILINIRIRTTSEDPSSIVGVAWIMNRLILFLAHATKSIDVDYNRPLLLRVVITSGRASGSTLPGSLRLASPLLLGRVDRNRPIRAVLHTAPPIFLDWDQIHSPNSLMVCARRRYEYLATSFKAFIMLVVQSTARVFLLFSLPNAHLSHTLRTYSVHLPSHSFLWE